MNKEWTEMEIHDSMPVRDSSWDGQSIIMRRVPGGYLYEYANDNLVYHTHFVPLSQRTLDASGR